MLFHLRRAAAEQHQHGAVERFARVRAARLVLLLRYLGEKRAGGQSDSGHRGADMVHD